MQGTVYSHDSSYDNEASNKVYESKIRGTPREVMKSEKEIILKSLSGDKNELQVYEIPNAIKTIMSYVDKGYKLVFVSFSDVNTTRAILEYLLRKNNIDLKIMNSFDIVSTGLIGSKREESTWRKVLGDYEYVDAIYDDNEINLVVAGKVARELGSKPKLYGNV